jgi:curved DNA-binding protein CbpA
MDSTAADRLGLTGQFSSSELKKAKRAAAMLYHPDRMPNLADELKDAVNQRMAEIYAAYDKLKNDKANRH